jgi:hypothetical protein
VDSHIAYGFFEIITYTHNKSYNISAKNYSKRTLCSMVDTKSYNSEDKIYASKIPPPGNFFRGRIRTLPQIEKDALLCGALSPYHIGGIQQTSAIDAVIAILNPISNTLSSFAVSMKHGGT